MKTREFKFECKSCKFIYKEHTPETETSLEAECPECGEWNYKTRGKILSKRKEREIWSD